MINGIVFSKDRSAQLQLLLNSIEKKAKNIFELKVIYTSSHERYNKGYEKLIKQYPEVKWIKESSIFKLDVLNAIQNPESNYTCFFTDDDIIYRKINEDDLIIKLIEDENAFCFSTRLGKNTTRCYAMNAENIINPHYEDDKFISWNWQDHNFDFGYPLSVDGHVFRTEEIQKLTKKISFQNPNTYEAGLQAFSDFPRRHMWSYVHSALVNSPSNIVQKVYQNRRGLEYGVSTKELNDAFLSGQEIDFSKIDFSNIIGCHQELELPLTEFQELPNLEVYSRIKTRPSIPEFIIDNLESMDLKVKKWIRYFRDRF